MARLTTRLTLARIAATALIAIATGCQTLAALSPSSGLEDALRRSELSQSALRNADDVDQKLSSQVQFYPDQHPDVERVQNIVNRIVSQSLLKPNLQLKAKVINDDTVNAFVPGGKYVYVFRGLLQDVQSDDELAFVLGHEIAHVDEAHGDRGQFVRTLAVSTPEAICGMADTLSTFVKELKTCDQVMAATIIKRFGPLLPLAYGRKFESEADALGVYYAKKAGYNASLGAQFFKRRQGEYAAAKAQFDQEEARINADVKRAEAELMAAKGCQGVPLIGVALDGVCSAVDTATGAKQNPRQKQARIAAAEQRAKLARDNAQKAKLNLKAQELLWEWSSTHPAPDYRAENIEAMAKYIDSGEKPSPEILSPTLAVIDAVNRIEYDCEIGRLTCVASRPALPAVSGSAQGLLQAAQQRLNDQGFDCGTADGKMGKKTRTCLKQFQEQKALKNSGELDAPTRAALGL